MTTTCKDRCGRKGSAGCPPESRCFFDDGIKQQHFCSQACRDAGRALHPVSKPLCHCPPNDCEAHAMVDPGVVCRVAVSKPPGEPVPPEICTHPRFDVEGVCPSCGDKVALAFPVAFANRMREIEEGKWPPTCVVEPPARAPGSVPPLPGPPACDICGRPAISNRTVVGPTECCVIYRGKEGCLRIGLHRAERDLAEARTALASKETESEHHRDEWNDAADLARKLAGQRDALESRLAVTVGALERIISSAFHASGEDTLKRCLWCSILASVEKLRPQGPHYDGCPVGIAAAALAPTGEPAPTHEERSKDWRCDLKCAGGPCVGCEPAPTPGDKETRHG
jgi:hypothetical protein